MIGKMRLCVCFLLLFLAGSVTEGTVCAESAATATKQERFACFSVGNTVAAPGEEVVVPILYTGDRLGGFLLKLQYDTAHFAFLSAEPFDCEAGMMLRVQNGNDLCVIGYALADCAAPIFALLRFCVLPDAPIGSYAFTLSCPDAENVFATDNETFLSVCTTCLDGTVTVIEPSARFSLVGCQEAEAGAIESEEAFCVRLCGVAAKEMQNTAFEVLICASETEEARHVRAETPGDCVIGVRDGIQMTYPASDYGGAVFYTAILPDLPRRGTVFLFVTPYTETGAAGRTWILQYCDGRYVDATCTNASVAPIPTESSEM